MRVHILHNLRDEPWGGGNQFLKALRCEWIRQSAYADTPEEADVILVNSYPFGSEYLFDQLWRIKRQHPKKIVIYRLDGPISFIRGYDQDIDKVIRILSDAIVDGIVFQSCWCEEQNRQTFGIASQYQTVIHNAPNPTIFYSSTSSPSHLLTFPIKLIATSWSSNPRKGFDVYRFLDEHLDFNKYAMTFVGNSPVGFKHIKMIKPVSSQELSVILHDHDIFITASKTDPCSNSLIEAIACGLPAVALNDGGHPELVQNGGELFEGTQDILEKIDLVANHLSVYRGRLPVFELADVANRYVAFAQHILADVAKHMYKPKHGRVHNLMKIKQMILLWRTKNLWNKLIGSSS